MADNVRILSDDSLRREGFSPEQINGAKGRADAYVGEAGGIKYYRAENEINVNLDEYKSVGEMPDQFGEGNNRYGRQRSRDDD